MDREVVLALLRSLDDPAHGEAPPGFDRAGAEARFLVLARDIQAALGPGCAVETGVSIQDASFHGQIVLPEALWREVGDPLCVRTSNFGNLACLYCLCAEVPAALVAVILPILRAAGYIPVTDDVLSQPYDGGFPLHPPNDSWWFRYFDYL